MEVDAEVSLALTNPGTRSMTITHAVREANSSREVYLLLAAYLEAVRLGGELIEPFREIATAPLVSIEDVKERTLQLFFMLQAVSKSLDDNSRVAVKEALYVFGAVLDRLKSLEGGTGTGAPSSAMQPGWRSDKWPHAGSTNINPTVFSKGRLRSAATALAEAEPSIRRQHDNPTDEDYFHPNLGPCPHWHSRA
jgi:hypothetical protein